MISDHEQDHVTYLEPTDIEQELDHSEDRYIEVNFAVCDFLCRIQELMADQAEEEIAVCGDGSHLCVDQRDTDPVVAVEHVETAPEFAQLCEECCC